MQMLGNSNPKRKRLGSEGDDRVIVGVPSKLPDKGSHKISQKSRSQLSQDLKSEMQILRTQLENSKALVVELQAANVKCKADVELFRKQYSNASSAVDNAFATSTTLTTENQTLRNQVKEGMSARDLFQAAQESHFKAQIKTLVGQVALLKEQARLTGDDIRQKAATVPGLETRIRRLETEARNACSERDSLQSALKSEQSTSQNLRVKLRESESALKAQRASNMRRDIEAAELLRNSSHPQGESANGTVLSHMHISQAPPQDQLPGARAAPANDLNWTEDHGLSGNDDGDDSADEDFVGALSPASVYGQASVEAAVAAGIAPPEAIYAWPDGESQ